MDVSWNLFANLSSLVIYILLLSNGRRISNGHQLGVYRLVRDVSPVAANTLSTVNMICATNRIKSRIKSDLAFV